MSAVLSSSSALQLRPLTPNFGAEVLGLDLARITDAQFEQVYAAWLRHHVLLFRGQETLTNQGFEDFSARLGVLDPPPNQGAGRKSVPGYPMLYVVSNEKTAAGEALGALGDGEATWHTDMSYLPLPPAASMLWSIRIPPTGGDTWFCSMPDALKSMPPEIEALARKVEIKHDGTYDSGGNLRRGMQANDDPSTSAGTLHPAVIRHPESGVETLYLGRRRNAYVAGYDLAESERILDTLWQYAALEQNIYKHVWRLHDVVLWDNRSTMHRRDAFDPTAIRTMHRSQIKGKGDLLRA
ncbi:MAG TPA: TauD/TfdA family dioxygenase [Burkholderiales bacterium]|jgi:taurine dioxygenase